MSAAGNADQKNIGGCNCLKGCTTEVNVRALIEHCGILRRSSVPMPVPYIWRSKGTCPPSMKIRQLHQRSDPRLLQQRQLTCGYANRELRFNFFRARFFSQIMSTSAGKGCIPLFIQNQDWCILQARYSAMGIYSAVRQFQTHQLNQAASVKKYSTPKNKFKTLHFTFSF